MPVHAVVEQLGRGAVTKTILHHNVMIIQQETTIMYIETEERISLMSCCMHSWRFLLWLFNCPEVMELTGGGGLGGLSLPL